MKSPALAGINQPRPAWKCMVKTAYPLVSWGCLWPPCDHTDARTQTNSSRSNPSGREMFGTKDASKVIPSTCNSFHFGDITWLIPVCVVTPLVVKMTLPFKDNKTTNPPRAESSNSLSWDLADSPTITTAFRKLAFFQPIFYFQPLSFYLGKKERTVYSCSGCWEDPSGADRRLWDAWLRLCLADRPEAEEQLTPWTADSPSSFCSVPPSENMFFSILCRLCI